ncbi:hypothetical protein O181_003916 [Austropuccinia psidii MF-1]|uniref:Methylthioribulose-1-phosphate dehydratase n=1 Tax=Austropuccinia psidii MF-1 TaxID=1389203 RepID=A0A9Q3GEJ8_9BASI|nr:hypothetical protein [Austropuccinia psidii MF-1]
MDFESKPLGDIDVVDHSLNMHLTAGPSLPVPSASVPSPSSSGKRSWVWGYFSEVNGGSAVQCNVVKLGGDTCGRVLKKDKTGSTKSMHEHLMALHKMGDPQKRARTEAALDKVFSHGKKPALHDPLHPANLICELCRNFYQLGWVSGTGGGISIRHQDHVFIAPSGVQKERIKPCDIFILDLYTREQLRRPSTPLKQSACTPLFFNAYEHRNAGACIHTHSQHAVMATLLWTGDEFRCSHLEMIKGMRFKGTEKSMSYLDTLVIPIIENTPEEEDLREEMEKAMLQYPNTPAVLVRRHGTYSWGKDWEQAKCQAECLDYLLEVSVKMRMAGIPTEKNLPVEE